MLDTSTVAIAPATSSISLFAPVIVTVGLFTDDFTILSLSIPVCFTVTSISFISSGSTVIGISPYFSFSTEILVVGIEITPDKLYSPVESISLTST